MAKMELLTADLVVIGAGIAGLGTVLHAQSRCTSIILVNKGRLFFSGSSFANAHGRWGVTYARNDAEKEYLFSLVDNIAAGTNNVTLSRMVVEESFTAFRQLQDWGIEFVRGEDGRVLRTIPCYGTIPLASLIVSTRQVADSLARRLDKSVVTVLENHEAVQILTDGRRCRGCIVRNRIGKEIKITGKAVILTSGGDCGDHTPNIVDSHLVGDGHRLVKELGIPLKNMEYRQRVWQETGSGAEPFLLRHLFDSNLVYQDYLGCRISLEEVSGELRHLRRTHVPIANLHRDRVFDEMLLQRIPERKERYAIKVLDVQKGYTCRNRILPHYQVSNGGVEIDVNGRTPLPCLYAAGEVATGMHGGDRVGGMMIAAALVFGRRAASHACVTCS